MEVKVSQYVRLTARGHAAGFFREGAALFFQSTKFPGKLFVAAFGMDREHTSWPVHQTFIPFLDLTLQAARAEDPTPSTFEPGEIVHWSNCPSDPPRARWCCATRRARLARAQCRARPGAIAHARPTGTLRSDL